MKQEASLLIVDDDEDMLDTLSDILEERGYQIETAKTAKEAVTKAEERFFNVNLIDLKLPDASGIEILQNFRRKYPDRMNIVITAYATVQNAVEALNQGANAYIMKPADPEKLNQMIEEAYERQQEILKIVPKRLINLMEARTSWMRPRRFMKREANQVLYTSSRRSRLEILLDILEILARDTPQKTTPLMYKTNLNFKILKGLLGFLLNCNLIEARSISNSRIVYTITDKGKRAVKYLGKVEG